MKYVAIFSVFAALVAPATGAQKEDPAVVAKWRKHYSQHLPEAEKKLEACVANGFSKAEGEERIKCETARDAWHFQPYKPKPATFSSSGGRN